MTGARAMAAALLSLWLVGCVSTEPVSTPPHINLSPEDMQFGAGKADQALDFGLSVGVNESDSLENLEVLPGLRVRSVRSGSVADLAGIRSGDVILSVAGVETNQPDALAAVARDSEREQFAVKARRGTTVYETNMARPRQRASASPEELYRVDPIRSRAGYSTEVMTLADGERRTVARIRHLEADSPLAEAGLQEGDLLLAVDEQPIRSAQDLVNQLNSRELGARLNFTVVTQSDSAIDERRVSLWEPERRLRSLALWPLFTYESSLRPEQVEFSLLDFIVFSLFSYERQDGEKTYRVLGLFKFGSGYGELVEENP